MKIKKIKYSNNKILKFQTLKSYKSTLKKNNKKQLSMLQINLNNISNVIYKYTITNKKILFLDFPVKLQNAIKDTKHSIIPEYLSYNGILTNRISLNRITKTKNYSLSTLKLLLKIKKPDLVIMYSPNNKSISVQESHIARIPTIILNDNTNFNSKIAYKSFGNYKFVNEKAKNTNFTLSLIKSIMKKSKNQKQSRR